MTTVGGLLGPAAAHLAAVPDPTVAATARLDAELLLGHVLGIDRTRVLAYPEAPVGTGQAERFGQLVERRAAGEPVAYLRGFTEFHGLALGVDHRVLVPRPETEVLVEHALAEIARRLLGAPRPAGTAPLAVADVGTGSGAIAVALAVALRRRGMADEVVIIATDRSADAVDVARENAVGHGVADVVGLTVADLLPPAGIAAGMRIVPQVFDVVCANLPYIPTGALAGLPAPVRREPPDALDGGDDGLTVIGRLLGALSERTAEDAMAFLEIGADQGEQVAALVPEGWSCDVQPDLAGLPRVATLRRDAGAPVPLDAN